MPDIDKIKKLAEAIKERTEAASIWDDGNDSPMRVINTIDDLVIAILAEIDPDWKYIR